MGRIEDARDLVAVGAYRPGADAELDRALAKEPEIRTFLRQPLTTKSPPEVTEEQLIRLAQPFALKGDLGDRKRVSSSPTAGGVRS